MTGGRAKEGKWHDGPPPNGYAYDRQTGRLQVDTGEARLVRYVAGLALEVRDLGGVARILRKEAKTTRCGKVWSEPVRSRTLRNPVYVGDMRAEWAHHRIARHHRLRGSGVPEWEWCRRCGCELSGPRAYCSNCGTPKWLLADEDPEPIPAPATAEDPEGDPVR